MQIFKKMIEDGLAWQYQLKIEYSNCKALIFYIYIYIYIYIYNLLTTAKLLYKLK